MELDSLNVFVKYLPSDVQDRGLRALFAAFGRVVSAKVMVDHNMGCSLGYGYVRFSYPEEAQKAIDHMDGYKIGNKTLLCKLSNSFSYPEPSTNLFIKSLPVSFTEKNLEQLFSGFGNILTTKILKDKRTGESKQIGFVRS